MCWSDPFVEGVWTPKQGPRDSSDLVGQGDYRLVAMHAPIERIEPHSNPVSRSIQMDHAGTSAVNEQPADVCISALADPKQSRFAPGGVLSRHQTEPGSEIPRFPELVAVADRGDQRRRADRPDPGDRHEPTGCVMLCCEYFNLPGHGCKSHIGDLELLPEFLEKYAYRQCHRQWETDPPGTLNLTDGFRWFLREGGADAEGGGADGIGGFEEARG